MLTRLPTVETTSGTWARHTRLSLWPHLPHPSPSPAPIVPQQGNQTAGSSLHKTPTTLFFAPVPLPPVTRKSLLKLYRSATTAFLAQFPSRAGWAAPPICSHKTLFNSWPPGLCKTLSESISLCTEPQTSLGKRSCCLSVSSKEHTAST